MDTLNIKFNKYWYKHTLATLKWRLECKLQMSKMPWGKLYRHFWRKRLMKRITEVTNKINQRPVRDKATGKFSTDILTPVGHVQLFPPPGLVKPPVINPAQLARGLMAPAGVAVMDPAKIYKLTPDITLPEFPVIRRRICHLRKGKPWKFYTKPC